MKKIFLGRIVFLSAISMSAFKVGVDLGAGIFINYDKLYGRSNNSSNSSSKVFDVKLVYLVKGQVAVKYNNFNVGSFAKGKFSSRNWYKFK